MGKVGQAAIELVLEKLRPPSHLNCTMARPVRRSTLMSGARPRPSRALESETVVAEELGDLDGRRSREWFRSWDGMELPCLELAWGL